jgi:hypothetical protein
LWRWIVSDALDLDKIEARLKAATPGPYIADLDVFDHDTCEIEACVSSNPCTMLFTAQTDVNNDGTDEERARKWGVAKDGQAFRDALFLAHAPTDLAALVAEVRRLQAEADTMREWAERAAADENANAADLAEVTKERDTAVDAFHRCRIERDEARAALAEAEATIANERGEGTPPGEGWEWGDSPAIGDGEALWHKGDARVWRGYPDPHAARIEWFWAIGITVGEAAPTAREGMKAADEALRVRE